MAWPKITIADREGRTSRRGRKNSIKNPSDPKLTLAETQLEAPGKFYKGKIQAAKERGVRSPLVEGNITKAEVRQLSQKLGLPWWNKPAQPCLSSRFPYGEEITARKLHRVGRAEVHLHKLGYQNLRVRSEGDIARIELPPETIQDFILNTDLPALVKVFRGLGFIYVTLDLEGYRSGKLNQVFQQ